MKVLEVPFHYYPDAVGGTEVYTASLTRELLRKGVEVEIAAPGSGEEDYFHDGVQVYRFAPRSEVDDLSELYGIGDPVAAKQFGRILDHTQPDLVHLHAMSPAVSLLVVRELKRRDLPVVFTYHIPGITCPRGTLLRYGRSVCDGVWGLHKCSRCALHAHGLIKPLSQVLGSLPPVVGRSASALGWQGRAATVLRTTELQALRQRALVAFFAEVDQVVAVSQWVRQMLLRNGVPSEKITLSPHGIAQSSGHQSGTAAAAKGSRLRTPVRVGFVGRLYPIKGAHVLIEALRQRPDLPLELDLFGVIQDGTSRMYEQELRRSASGDTRVRFLAPLPAEDVVPRLREYDFLAVPSQCVETGPLVVLEASAAGIPVIGSNLGGISELVEHEQNGLLVDAADTTAWIRALERICCEPALACRLRAGVRLPRAMSVVADEMIALYHKAIEGVPCVARI